jgi:putative endonuclease
MGSHYHYVYILYSAKLAKYYIGRTEDVELRLKFHNEPIESRKFTAKGIPWELKIAIPCQSLDQATKLESFIKRMKSKRFVESVISSEELRNDLLKKTAPDC